MVGELMTLPLRLGARAAETALRTSLNVSGRTLNVAGQLIKTVTGGGADGAPARTEDAQTSAARESSAPAQEEPAAQPSARAPVDTVQSPPPPPAREPTHVSEEPVLVEERAEPGAEEGAGATIEIAEPWEDYDHMTAKNIAARLRSCSAAELAVVELYESANRNRETVLAAVKRELKTAGSDGRIT